jgi:serine-type D-Ala-D-Ala carboxypeptidase (penicillin-binding protein 5/6)
MRRRAYIRMRASAAMLLLASAAVFAGPEAPDAAAPRLAVKGYYLVDYATNTPLAESAESEQLEPASLTKLMTAYVIFGALKSGRLHAADEVAVSEKAWRMRGSRMFIEVNSKVSVDDLLHGLLIQSGNDASVALAEHLAGSVGAFVEEMNAAAAALGMHDSVFRNPHGLPARGHVSSARDLAVLARAIIAEFPEYYGLYAQREFTYNGITQQNRNALLRRDPSVDGMKTGHTVAAGYCLVSSAERGGMRLIAVVLGAETPKARNDGAEALLEYGFANYETHKLYGAGDKVDSARVFGGEREYAEVGPLADVYVTIPRGGYGDLAANLAVRAELAAPLAAGQAVGELNVTFGGMPLLRAPLVVLREIADGGVWARFRDGLDAFRE